jgi:uncharacterized protein YajQ (UPF0234 family)
MYPSMNPDSFKLTLEQEFKVKQMTDLCEQLSKEELKKAFLDLLIQSEIRMNVYKDLLKRF